MSLDWVKEHELATAKRQEEVWRLASQIVLAMDDPMWDCTDAAHPAWWRGNDAGVQILTARLQQVVDGKDSGSGVIGYEPLEKLRRDILELVAFKKRHADILEGISYWVEMAENARFARKLRGGIPAEDECEAIMVHLMADEIEWLEKMLKGEDDV